MFQRWARLQLLLIGLVLALLLIPLGQLALSGLLGTWYVPIRLTLLIAAIALGALGALGAILDSPATEAALASTRPPQDTLTIGWDPAGGWIRLDHEAQQRHVLLLGSSGSGKTQLLLSLLSQQISRGGGALMIDAKVDRSALDTVVALCRAANRLHDLRIVWPPDPGVSDTWNPLLRGGQEEILARIMALWGPTGGGERDFWKGTAHTIIASVLGAMRRINPLLTFTDLYLALTTTDVLLWLEAMTPGGTEEAAAITAFLSNYRGAGGKVNIDQLKRLTGGAPQYLYPYAFGNLGQIMNHTAPTLDFLEALQSNAIVYIALPILKQTEEAIAMARVAVADLKQAVGALQQLPNKPNPPFLVLLDEASAYSNVQGIERLFEQARSAHVSLIAASQVLSGFASVKKEQLDFILGNTATKIIMTLGDYVSAETMAETIGEQLRWFASESISTDRGTSSPWIAPLPTRISKAKRDMTGSMQRYDFTVRPEQLMSQQMGRAIVLTKHPTTGPTLYRDTRTVLTRLDHAPAADLQIRPRVGPAGLDILRLLQEGEIANPAAATPPVDRAARPRRSGVRRRTTKDVIVLEPRT